MNILFLSLYSPAGFWQIEDRFLPATGNVAHFSKNADPAQVKDMIARIHLARIEIRTQRTFTIICMYNVGIRGEAYHWRGRNIGKLISKNRIIHFLIGSDIKFLRLLIYSANNLSNCAETKRQ